MKFVFDQKHDLKFSKPVERMIPAASMDVQKYLKIEETNKT